MRTAAAVTSGDGGQKSDQVKDATFAAVGMRLIRFNVRNMPSVEQIRTALGDGTKLQSSRSFG